MKWNRKRSIFAEKPNGSRKLEKMTFLIWQSSCLSLARLSFCGVIFIISKLNDQRHSERGGASDRVNALVGLV
jgi:hypothetical protein